MKSFIFALICLTSTAYAATAATPVLIGPSFTAQDSVELAKSRSKFNFRVLNAFNNGDARDYALVTAMESIRFVETLTKNTGIEVPRDIRDQAFAKAALNVGVAYFMSEVTETGPLYKGDAKVRRVGEKMKAELNFSTSYDNYERTRELYDDLVHWLGQYGCIDAIQGGVTIKKD